jgi:NAD(P)-dependent dehydrogenase (short-subunit alcohol dehydrogenase family)
MAVELAEYGIRVNVVSPGTVDTAMPLEHVGAEALQRMRDGMPGVPIGRLADPSEVASVFAFLASSEASYISGHNLIVDGGLTAQVYDAPRS